MGLAPYTKEHDMTTRTTTKASKTAASDVPSITVPTVNNEASVPASPIVTPESVVADRSVKEATAKATAKAKTATPKAPATSGKVVAKGGRLTIVTTPQTPADKRKARLDAARARAEGTTVGEIATAIGTAEVAKEAADHTVEAKTRAVEEAKTAAQAAKEAAKAKADGLRQTLSLMVTLAALCNPTLTAPKTGPASGPRKEAIDALVLALGIERKTAQARVARWIGAGSLFIGQGTPIAEAYTTANTMLGSNGQAAEFWALVTAEAPTKEAAKVTRKPQPPAPKETPKIVAPSVDVARTVVKEADTKRVAGMTPQQRTSDVIRQIVDLNKILTDGVKAGTHAKPSRADQTKVETIMATLAKGA